MKHHFKLPIIFTLSCILLILFSSIVFASEISETLDENQNQIIAKYGSRGKIVEQIQTYLYKLNYLKKSQIDRCYGKITREAVKSFQLEHSLEETGIVDSKTYELLKESTNNQNFFEYIIQKDDTLTSISLKYNVSIPALMIYNNLSEDSILQIDDVLKIPTNIMYLSKTVNRGRIAVIQAIPWSIVNQLWKVGEVAMITDYLTQKSFYVKRLGGNLHADIEPITVKDTKILYSLNGTWTWDRRAVIITIHRQRIAASINVMPHSVQRIYNNGFNGHLCCHVIGSRTHQSQNVDNEHLEKIKEVEIDAKEILTNSNL
jgi:LysM repeat protein